MAGGGGGNGEAMPTWPWRFVFPGRRVRGARSTTTRGLVLLGARCTQVPPLSEYLGDKGLEHCVSHYPDTQLYEKFSQSTHRASPSPTEAKAKGEQ